MAASPVHRTVTSSFIKLKAGRLTPSPLNPLTFLLPQTPPTRVPFLSHTPPTALGERRRQLGLGFRGNPSSIPMDSSENRNEGSPEAADLMFDNRGCCCFIAPWSRRRTSASTSADWWERIHASDRSGAAARLAEASMKLRNWSEVAAGPRWKTFIRRFNKNSRHLGGSTRLGVRFQYDPLSYALNFDENADADAGFRDFSSRFAAPPLPVKSSMDLGGRDAPPLFADVLSGD